MEPMIWVKRFRLSVAVYPPSHGPSCLSKRSSSKLETHSYPATYPGLPVYWNPEGTDILAGEPSPITDLAHEMWHGYEGMNGMDSQDSPIKNSDLRRSEYRACYFENRIRYALGLQTRYTYGRLVNPETGGVTGRFRVTQWNGKPLYVPPYAQFNFIFNGMPIMHNLIY